MDILTTIPHSPLSLEQLLPMSSSSSFDSGFDLLGFLDEGDSLFNLPEIDPPTASDLIPSFSLENFSGTLQKEEQPQTATQAPVLNKPMPKKRGRKPKIKVDIPRPRKPKVYELEPLEDKESERRRKNAITARLHRNKTKKRLLEIQDEVEKVKKETEDLKKMLNKLQKTTAHLQKQLEEQQRNDEAISIIS